MPVDAAPIDVVLDLRPCLLEQSIPLRSGDPPRLSHKSETSGVGLPGQDHSLKVIDSLGGGLCVGFWHGQSTLAIR